MYKKINERMIRRISKITKKCDIPTIELLLDKKIEEYNNLMEENKTYLDKVVESMDKIFKDNFDEIEILGEEF